MLYSIVMAEKNPFILSFVREPNIYIPRLQQTQRIIDTFTILPVTDQVFIVKGVRGSGNYVKLEIM